MSEPLYLCDTNILRQPVEPKGDRNVIRRLGEIPDTSFYTSVFCYFEVRSWTLRSHDPGKLQRKLEMQVFPNLKLLDFRKQEAEVAADVREELRRKGIKVPGMDLLIGATAKAHDMILVTRNVRDFERIPGLRIENWFGRSA